MSRLFAALAVPAVLMAATAAPVPKAPPKPEYYFPTEVGAERVFRLANGGEKRDVVSAVEKDGDGLLVSMSDPARKDAVNRVLYVAKDKVQIVQQDQHRYATPLLVFRPDAKPGDTWSFTGDPAEQVQRCAGEEEVEVPAGKFKAVRVDYGQETPQGFSVETTVWYAPGLGSVRQVVGGKEYLSLKSFTRGKPAAGR